ncbi:hypothetical protein [Mucisphaera sp.]|uniref:hypothetical protein n=1 Tax=Mucisphaera sp. TaxID=2913024 RepID=UPI003D12D18A
MIWGFEDNQAGGRGFTHVWARRDAWGRNARANWALSVAILLAVLVILLPLLALLLLAVVVGLVSYVVFSLIALVLDTLSGLLGTQHPGRPGEKTDDDGRRNVRIIR